MSFTVADIVTEARELLLDETVPYRYSDDFIVRKVNQILRRMVVVRPDLFTHVTTMMTVAGSLQTCPADSVRLMDVSQNGSGEIPKEVDQEALDMMFPRWASSSVGATKSWMRLPRDPNRFYVYPPSAGSEMLTIMYARSLPTYALADTINIQDAYQPVVLDGVCWLMESLDAEHVETSRAKMFQESYTTALGASLLARGITDSESGGGSTQSATNRSRQG